MSGLDVRVVDNVVVVAEGLGPPGPQGPGVPVGGNTGQVLAKASDADNDTVWRDESGGVGAAVLYTAQALTAPQKTQGRSNIDAEQAGAAATAVAAHSGDLDPHGDRAFASAADATHAAAAGAHPLTGVDGLTAALALLAPLLSPALTGTPTAPTAAGGTASTQIATTAFVAAAISALIGSVPGALDTLDELAAAMGDDPNFAATVTSALAGKLAKASNLADLVDAAAARGNLGAGAVGGQVFVAATAAAIRTLLELGTAATTAATAFATAAQGATADTAVQPARSVSTQHSLSGGGDLSTNRTLALVGDTASPGNLKMYGTDASGNRGWYDQPSGGGGSPGGSGSQLQHRVDATTFGGAAGSHWDVATGRLAIGAGTGTPAGMVHAQASAASVIPVVLQGAASQTANLSDWRNSAGTTVAFVDATGAVRTSSFRDSGVGQGRLGFTSGYTSLFGYDGKHAFAISTSSGIVALPFGLGFGPNYYTNDITVTRLDTGVIRLRGASDAAGAALNIRELSADPADPPEGTFTQWMSDGTGAGDDGDVMVKITVGGVTKTATLIDYSAV